MTAPPMGGPPVPTCYRHADRETYIQCVRCGKSICPDCMRDAAVGFQCPECVREGNRSLRPATNSLGNRRPSGDPMLLTKILVGVNVVVFVLSGLSNLGGLVAGNGISPVQQRLLLIPHYPDQLYRLVTSGFIHFGFLHIALNMYVLWTIGQQLEPALGRLRFGVFYFVALLGGSAAAFSFSTNASGGASGAVYGLFAALFVLGRRLHLDVRGIAVVIGINLAISFVFSGYISWQAHVGGLIAGLLLAAAFVYAPRGPARVPLQAAGVVAVLALSAVVIAFGWPASTV